MYFSMLSVAVATSDSSVSFEAAHVPQPHVFAVLNTSQVLTCASQGQQPLHSCLWVRNNGSNRDGIFIDKEGAHNDGGGQEDESAISFVGSRLDGANCSIRIELITGNDFGRWSCRLMSKTGQIFVGNVNVYAAGKYSNTSICF